MPSEEPETAPFVLVANDQSACGKVAADAGVRIARALDVTVRGIYVVDVNLVMEPYVSLHAELGDDSGLMTRDEWMARFEAFGDSTLADLKATSAAYDRPFSGEVIFGGVTELILKEASRPAARLLALGRRGRSTEGSGLGGHFGDVAHHVEIPLLVGGSDEVDFKRFLIVHDGGDHADDVCRFAGQLAAPLSAQVTLVGIGDPNGEASEGWVDRARKALGPVGEQAKVAEPDGEGGAAILAAADRANADVIVMSHFRHQAWVQWLVGSPAEYVLRHDERPVLLA